MKTSIYIGTSLDGFIAREDGGLDWLMAFADGEAVSAYNEFMSGIDVIIIGRGTFETVMTFPAWPYDKKVFVLSSTLRELPASVADRASLVSMPPNEVLSGIERQGFASAYIDGGKVIQSFLKDDLIDELIIATMPVLIGRGIPLFGRLPRDLAFIHMRTSVASNGLVRSYYRRRS